MFAGLLRAVGQQLFNATVTSEIMATGEENLEDAGKQYYAIFRVSIVGEKDNISGSSRSSLRNGMSDSSDYSSAASVPSVVPATSVVTPQLFCNIFPFHIVFDSDLRLIQVSTGLGTVLCCMLGTVLGCIPQDT